jgi:hypothetical protein
MMMPIGADVVDGDDDDAYDDDVDNDGDDERC